jgi:hypothetical protein
MRQGGDSVIQPSLLADVDRHERPHKRVRAVSKAVYRELCDSGRLSQRTADTLRCLAAYYDAWEVWPTVAELALWMWQHKDLPRPDSRLCAPRITELSRGVKNRTTGAYEGGGVIEALPARPCRVAGSKAHPWRVVPR